MKWLVKSEFGRSVRSLDELEDELLRIRGALDQRQHFFNPQYTQVIGDPILMSGVEAAVDRIYTAREKGERVMIYGDYDVDGVTSTAILLEVLEVLGLGAVPFLPHRTDHGYGLDIKVLRKVSPEIDLLITVDCGISNKAEVAWLQENGVDVIVTDHHELPDWRQDPGALAVVHPRHPQGQYPFGWLCGAGVVWKLAMALLRDQRSPFKDDPDKEKWLLDLVCLGTIADMVPLLGENRAVVLFGLEVLRRSPRPGIKVLLEEARGGEINEELVAYRIAPLLNAAGRMDHPQSALDLLLAENEQQARLYMGKLKRLNRARRSVSDAISASIELELVEGADFVFASDMSWQPGVVGLVAGRLARNYNVPAFVIGGNGDLAVGSVRAPKGVNVLAAIKAGEDLMTKFGGHESAAGFSLENKNIPLLREVLSDYFGTNASSGENTRLADVIVEHELIDIGMWERLQRFAPFGEGNTKPLIGVERLPLLDWRVVGKKGEHVKYTFQLPDKNLDGIGFGIKDSMDKQRIMPGQDVDVLAYVEMNEFRGRRNLQLSVQDIAKSD